MCLISNLNSSGFRLQALVLTMPFSTRLQSPFISIIFCLRRYIWHKQVTFQSSASQTERPDFSDVSPEGVFKTDLHSLSTFSSGSSVVLKVHCRADTILQSCPPQIIKDYLSCSLSNCSAIVLGFFLHHTILSNFVACIVQILHIFKWWLSHFQFHGFHPGF